MELLSRILEIVSNPREKPGSPENGIRMMKQLQAKLDAKVQKCDRCKNTLNEKEIKNPRIIINYFENWLLCRSCR